MAYPKHLNEQYKAEKAAGTTTATSFREWNKYRLGMLEIDASVDDKVDEALQQAGPASLEEVTNIVEKSIEQLEELKEAVQVSVVLSKAALALQIYNEAEANAAAAGIEISRKDIIKRFMVEAELSKAGAQTYYQNIRRKKGLISS